MSTSLPPISTPLSPAVPLKTRPLPGSPKLLSTTPESATSTATNSSSSPSHKFASSPPPVTTTTTTTPTPVPCTTRYKPAMLTFLAFALWGTGYSINATASDVISTDDWVLFVSLTATGRCIGLVIIMLIMGLRKQIPATVSISGWWLLSALINFLVPIGLTAILFLTSTGDVSFIIPISSMYLVVPIGMGLLRGESRNPAKLIGIVLGLASVLLNGVGGSGSTASDGEDSVAEEPSFFFTWGLLLLVMICFATIDSISGVMGRKIHMFIVAFVGAFSSAVIAMAMGMMHSSGTSHTQLNLDHVLVVFANLVSAVAWFCYTLLGRTGEQSRFAPIVGLYVFTPPVISLLFRGEELTSLRLVGLIAAAVGILLIAKQPTKFVFWGRGKPSVAKAMLKSMLAFRLAGKKHNRRVRAASRISVMRLSRAGSVVTLGVPGSGPGSVLGELEDGGVVQVLQQDSSVGYRVVPVGTLLVGGATTGGVGVVGEEGVLDVEAGMMEVVTEVPAGGDAWGEVQPADTVLPARAY